MCDNMKKQISVAFGEFRFRLSNFGSTEIDKNPRYSLNFSREGAIDWKSTKQSIFTTLFVEVEYIATYDASKKAVWVRKFIFELGVVSIIEEPIKKYCDNTGAIAIANESGITKGARLFHAKVHYLYEVIEYDDIKLEKIHTNDNLADSFTKALAFTKNTEHTKNIGMLLASSLM
uniref:Retrovirus-related Pol polyprotein from transposon TNT 1-94 n=1 Tax=Tanacetum cinerariifolium TaxID=118510 RepID=A0A6L2JIF0_TANCI|nr:hypothetical protein [Tanacetum cinerariifolium]